MISWGVISPPPLPTAQVETSPVQARVHLEEVHVQVECRERPWVKCLIAKLQISSQRRKTR